MKLILASGSPRRKELLSSFDVEIEIIKPGIDEVRQTAEPLNDYVARNAQQKGKHVLKMVSDVAEAVVVSADTIVVVDGVLLEKPADELEATNMLASLSGRSHHVYTSYSILGCGSKKGLALQETVCSTVKFKPLSKLEIDSYVATGESLDKAGGYGIQAYGAFMIDSIDGSYTNIVGLPLAQFVSGLGRVFNISLLPKAL